MVARGEAGEVQGPEPVGRARQGRGGRRTAVQGDLDPVDPGERIEGHHPDRRGRALQLRPVGRLHRTDVGRRAVDRGQSHGGEGLRRGRARQAGPEQHQVLVEPEGVGRQGDVALRGGARRQVEGQVLARHHRAVGRPGDGDLDRQGGEGVGSAVGHREVRGHRSADRRRGLRQRQGPEDAQVGRGQRERALRRRGRRAVPQHLDPGTVGARHRAAARPVGADARLRAGQQLAQRLGPLGDRGAVRGEDRQPGRRAGQRTVALLVPDGAGQVDGLARREHRPVGGHGGAQPRRRRDGEGRLGLADRCTGLHRAAGPRPGSRWRRPRRCSRGASWVSIAPEASAATSTGARPSTG